MKLLLDTHAFIWWDSDPAQLSAPVLAALRDPANEVWLSVASVWGSGDRGSRSIKKAVTTYCRDGL